MSIHYLQHVPFEGLGAIEDWCEIRGHSITVTRLFSEPLPPRFDGDLLVVLGGPMNVYEEGRHPWLAAEKRFLRGAIADGARVLGICLGAQLLSAVLGGSVSPNPEKEIGWYPIELTAEAGTVPGFDRLPRRFTALHWHGDTFSIPEGAVRLAGSTACANQAFAWDGGRVLGLQFHLEETVDSLALLVEHAAHEVAPPRAGATVAGDAAPWVSSADELLAPDAPFASCKALLFDLLDVHDGHRLTV
jgi:GMP synthase-like glutamine amidotransferase